MILLILASLFSSCQTACRPAVRSFSQFASFLRSWSASNRPRNRNLYRGKVAKRSWHGCNGGAVVMHTTKHSKAHVVHVHRLRVCFVGECTAKRDENTHTVQPHNVLHTSREATVTWWRRTHCVPNSLLNVCAPLFSISSLVSSPLCVWRDLATYVIVTLLSFFYWCLRGVKDRQRSHFLPHNSTSQWP